MPTKTQHIFLTSRNRDAGTPGDCVFTFPNGLVDDPTDSSTLDFSLLELTIPRTWFDVDIGINNYFTIRKLNPANNTVSTTTITIPPGFYTGGPDVVGAGSNICTALAAAINNAAIDTVQWAVVINNTTGCFQFNAYTSPTQTGGSGPTASYVFDFSINSAPRAAQLLGAPANSLVTSTFNRATDSNGGYEFFVFPRPFLISRTSNIVLHTDLQTIDPANTIDNIGPTKSPLAPSDVIASIPVEVPPRGIISYRNFDSGNSLTLQGSSIRSVRFFFTDHHNLPLNLISEWSAVFMVVRWY